MRIALEATEAAYPDLTGTGTYSHRLISALAGLPPFQSGEHRLSLCFRIRPYFRWARKLEWPRGAGIAPFWEPWLPPQDADLFHGLNQRLPRRSYPARVVTIHDLFPLTSTTYSTADFQRTFRRVIEDALAKADRVITVSNATRQEILRHTGTPDERIRVIHHGVDPPRPAAVVEQRVFREQVLKIGAQDKVFLNVGVIQVRKNVGNIVRATAKVSGCKLVLAGGDGFGASEVHSLIERERLSDRVIRLGHASRDMLRRLYSTATALVFPSLEEGFGMPLLEAMSYGLPVITSNCSAMPEVAGDAALYVEPVDVDSIAEAMRRVAEDGELAADLARRGQARAALFSWERCAQQAFDLYRELLRLV